MGIGLLQCVAHAACDLPTLSSTLAGKEDHYVIEVAHAGEFSVVTWVFVYVPCTLAATWAADAAVDQATCALILCSRSNLHHFEDACSRYLINAQADTNVRKPR